MTVSVEMHGAVIMAVPVKMHAIAPQPPQHMGAETDQHQSHRRFHRPRQVFRKRLTEQYRRPGNGEQRQRMAEPQVRPCLTMSPTWVRRAAMLETAAM